MQSQFRVESLVCEQLDQSHYLTTERLGVKLFQHPNRYTTKS